MKARSLLTYLFVVLAVLAIGLAGPRIIYDSSPVIELKKSPLSEPVALALQGAQTYRPIEGKDFTIKSTKYFDNNVWAVVLVSPIGSFSDSGSIVLKENNGVYQTVFGPANSFTSSDLGSLPTDISNYLLQ